MSKVKKPLGFRLDVLSFAWGRKNKEVHYRLFGGSVLNITEQSWTISPFLSFMFKTVCCTHMKIFRRNASDI